MNIRIGPVWIHRLEQWDIDCWPIVCIHWKTPNRSRRIFCLWHWGVQIGSGRRAFRYVLRGR